VLSDDIPLNDPFGGWVYWDRIPHAAIDTVEVSAGGASSLYGSDALGGVVNIIRRPVDHPALTAYASYGNQRTPDASLFGSETHGPWAGAVDAEVFYTDGYIPVPVDQRGTVDSFASSEYATGDLTVERRLSDRGRVFLRGSWFGESRNNGTLLQKNRTTIRELNGGGDWHSDACGHISLAAYAGREVFNQTFSSISADRNTETLTRVQRVPAQAWGMDAQWSRGMSRHQTLVAGMEAHEFRGESGEMAIATNTALNAGGRQRNIGVFGEDLIQVTPRWLLTPVARVDHWTNFDAFSSTQSFPAGPIVRTPLAERSETFFSPRLGMLYRLTAHVSLTGSAYRSFRAPTLNELYRSFRLGNIETHANDQLLAERLTGGEGGVIVTGFHQRLMVRSNFFWAEITRPIANVTLSTTPMLVTRQRENLGRTRSRGVEAEAEAHISGALTLSGGFQYADATVVNFPGNAALVGLDIPQVPRHVVTVQTRYFKPRWVTLGVQGRFVGVQYDDDLKRLPLRRFFTMDAMASHPLTPALDAFIAADNLLNQRYDIARTPVLSVAPPILVRAGVRLNLGTR
jgi:outer membrane receptor protein involved in Fe transport